VSVPATVRLALAPVVLLPMPMVPAEVRSPVRDRLPPAIWREPPAPIEVRPVRALWPAGSVTEALAPLMSCPAARWVTSAGSTSWPPLAAQVPPARMPLRSWGRASGRLKVPLVTVRSPWFSRPGLVSVLVPSEATLPALRSEGTTSTRAAASELLSSSTAPLSRRTVAIVTVEGCALVPVKETIMSPDTCMEWMWIGPVAVTSKKAEAAGGPGAQAPAGPGLLQRHPASMLISLGLNLAGY
jgi:hypothetical protein